MTEMRLRRMSRVLRLRGVDIGFDVYGERQGESSRKRRDKFAAGSGSRKAAEPGGKISVERRRGLESVLLLPGFGWRWLDEDVYQTGDDRDRSERGVCRCRAGAEAAAAAREGCDGAGE